MVNHGPLPAYIYQDGVLVESKRSLTGPTWLMILMTSVSAAWASCIRRSANSHFSLCGSVLAELMLRLRCLVAIGLDINGISAVSPNMFTHSGDQSNWLLNLRRLAGRNDHTASPLLGWLQRLAPRRHFQQNACTMHASWKLTPTRNHFWRGRMNVLQLLMIDDVAALEWGLPRSTSWLRRGKTDWHSPTRSFPHPGNYEWRLGVCYYPTSTHGCKSEMTLLSYHRLTVETTSLAHGCESEMTFLIKLHFDNQAFFCYIYPRP